jgi:1,4-alpha-glucan branching enzyme
MFLLTRGGGIATAAIEAVKKIKGSIGRATTTKQQIEFTFHAPESKKIYIAGTFKDWNTKSRPMRLPYASKDPQELP